MKKLLLGLIGFVVSMAGLVGYYPLLPAFYGTYCLDKKKNYYVYVGIAAGMFLRMSFYPFMKYLLVLGVIDVGIKLYWVINKKCSGWVAGIIAGAAVCAFNFSSTLMIRTSSNEIVYGIGEGFIVAGATVLMHYVLEIVSNFDRELVKGPVISAVSEPSLYNGRTEAFAVAVEELSHAFKAMDIKSENENSKKIDMLEHEITGRLCACCDECTVCWNRNKYSLSDNIRRLILDAIRHISKEELFGSKYVKDCPKYHSMVDEAIEAVGRVEVNEAWHKRLRENRLIIAQQLNAMSDLLHGWSDEYKKCDCSNKIKIARIIYETKEKGILAENVHVYEDIGHRMCIKATVAGKLTGGIPMKNYRIAVEKATGLRLRLEKEAKAIITKNADEITLYEDTDFYTLPGIAVQKKSQSPVSGDSFVMFELDNGKYNICISDGMGSGNDARRESETVVDLMEKFMEAGFKKETAVKLMNSAMVLQGTKESYSTLDFAEIDLYTGKLELLKVGASASFIKRGKQVEIITSDTLPAGVDPNQELRTSKKSLEDGDFLVMVTDGVLEYLHVEEPENALLEIISDIRTDNAGVLAKSILDKVLECTGGYAIDDMTVLATGIWEK